MLYNKTNDTSHASLGPKGHLPANLGRHFKMIFPKQVILQGSPKPGEFENN